MLLSDMPKETQEQIRKLHRAYARAYYHRNKDRIKARTPPYSKCCMLCSMVLYSPTAWRSHRKTRTHLRRQICQDIKALRK